MDRSTRRFLLYCAEGYAKLGYSVGLSKDKVLLDAFEVENGTRELRSQSLHSSKRDWNGISIILDDIVCVDFDRHDMVSPGDLPITWTEKTARGVHYFYRLPKDGRSFRCRTAFREHLDLLVKERGRSRRTLYGGDESTTWFGHVLVSPTTNYQRTYPEDKIIPKDQLPLAPRWVLDALV